MQLNTNPDQINEVLSRGVAEVLPNRTALVKLMTERPIKVYLGIDPSGPLLTLGHSVVLRKLQQFANLGHEVILLIGNGTVRIGDPTGRDTSRPILTDEQIEANFKDWRAQASKILDFSKIKIMHNGDWLDKLSYADMVKLMAQVTVQQLIERDMFQTRIKKGLPIFGHEIMYPVLQGYDSVAMNVDLEIGGTDQTFNMLMGRTLQKAVNNREKWVLSTPLINGTDGRKMSKSFGNYVALTDEPSQMYGKLMSISDDMIIQYFTVLTDETLDAIGDMEQAMQSGDNPMQFKKQLAWTITKMYHTAEAANQAQANFESGVQNKEVPDDAQEIEVSQAELAQMTVLNLLQKCVPEESSSNLRRLVEQNAIEFQPSNYRPSDPFEKLAGKEFESVRVGKRRFYKIVWR